jgi:hypothetical protein
MALSRQTTAPIFDNEEQKNRWIEQMKYNKKYEHFRIPMTANKETMIPLLVHIVNFSREEFIFRQLSLDMDPYEARSTLNYLSNYGIILKTGQKKRGYVYRQMFDADEIPTIINERNQKIKSLTRRQKEFLEEIKEEHFYGLAGKRRVKVEGATIVYYWYLRFRGGLNDANKIDYFAGNEQTATGINKGKFQDIPLKFGQVRKMLGMGAESGIFERKDEGRKKTYKFNQKIIRGGVKELKKQVGLKEER